MVSYFLVFARVNVFVPNHLCSNMDGKVVNVLLYDLQLQFLHVYAMFFNLIIYLA